MAEVYIFPTSYAQRRLWFLDRLEPGSPLYNVFDLIPLYGTLDAASLKRALDEVVNRHEALRTTFGVVDGDPVQVVASIFQPPLQSIDLREHQESERGAEVLRLTFAEYERPFDLERGPLLRATLLRLGDEENLLLIVTHHIISDGWSLGIFRRELLELYDSYSSGKPSTLVELPVQYADYALWQREWLQGGALDEQLAYWKAQLAGHLAPIELPTDLPRPPVQMYQGATQQIRLSAELAESLKALSRREGATFFMTMLAAFFTLLHRYTNRADLLVGTPVAGRGRSELEGLIGFFVNTLVIRVDLADDPVFRALLKRVQESCLGAYAHQDVPFELLVEELRPERDPGRNPVFQVMFQLITADTLPDDTPFGRESAGEEDDEIEIKIGTAKFDLGMDVCECNDGSMTAAIEYSTDLFQHETIRRMLRHLKVLLKGIAADPARHLSQIPLLTEIERRQLLLEWNSTERAYPGDASLHQLFEEQVERTPDAIAIVSEAGQLSYRELNSRANKLARHLRSLGVRPETRVGICLERSIGAIVSLLGILKAGGAYVPLDPAYPQERLFFMLEDVMASVLITEKKFLSVLPNHELRIVCLERDWEQIEREDEANPDWEVLPENLAYVIYTSGSTGSPKGVMIQQRSLVNFTLAAVSAYELSPADRVLQFSSISFDTAAEEIYTSLTIGATLVLSPIEASYSVETLVEKCREFGITVLDLPTAYWHELTWELESRKLRLPASVRMVIFGGERALPERLSMWHRSVSGDAVRLMHGYGPTEATVIATVSDLTKPVGAETTSREVPIGRPISNAQTYILDTHYEPVAVGVSGELYIGGDGLARGYLHRPELTAERFIPNAFSTTVGTRLYRTGDIARYLPDGEIEFLGRRDGQVKVRGYRVEVGEVEAVLRVHEGVRDAVVVAREDGSGHKALAAYVVAGGGNGERVTVGELRGELKARLPEYMVPASFVMLEELPLNANGKIDRNALPDPKLQHDDAAVVSGDDAPRTEAERAIAAVWREVLGVEPSSVHSNFFDLGGHSLALIRVNSKLRDYFSREIPIIDMFKYPTISLLADSLGRGSNGQSHNYQQVQDRAAKQKEALSRQMRAGESEAITK